MHLKAHKHHLSPAFKPLKLYIGISLVKSFPLFFEKSKNSSVIIAQTVCVPMSLLPVLQNPSLYTPVTGFKQHNSRSLPKTFNCPTLCEFSFRILSLTSFIKNVHILIYYMSVGNENKGVSF